MKRIASLLVVAFGIAGAAVGTASADSNVGLQYANISQTSVAASVATQYAGGAFSTNLNASKAVSANYASIGQWLIQVNH